MYLAAPQVYLMGKKIHRNRIARKALFYVIWFTDHSLKCTSFSLM